MAEKMQWDPSAPYKYDFERGLYYHHIVQGVLLCGSQPTSAEDVHYLANAETVGTILSVRSLLLPVQQPTSQLWCINIVYPCVEASVHVCGKADCESNAAVRDRTCAHFGTCATWHARRLAQSVYESPTQTNTPRLCSCNKRRIPHEWGVDVGAIHNAMQDAGVSFVRTEVIDFDPNSLRAVLPRAVREIAAAVSRGDQVYVHCTAGLGRAPAAIIAYLFWFQNYTLNEAYDKLTAVRPCGPKRDSIRGATFDLLDDRSWDEFAGLPEFAFSELNDDDRRAIQRKVCGGEPPAQPAL